MISPPMRSTMSLCPYALMSLLETSFLLWTRHEMRVRDQFLFSNNGGRNHSSREYSITVEAVGVRATNGFLGGPDTGEQRHPQALAKSVEKEPLRLCDATTMMTLILSRESLQPSAGQRESCHTSVRRYELPNVSSFE